MGPAVVSMCEAQAGTDIAALIEPAGSLIAPFSIGFAKLNLVNGQEDASSAGSGALVSLGPVHGILTAAHVLQALPDYDEVGLVQFRASQTIQKQTIDMSFVEKLVIRGTGSAADGQDIGFLRLTSTHVAMLNASTNIFYNLTKRTEAVVGNKHPSSEYFEGLSGIIGEWTLDHPPGEAAVHRLKGFRGLFGVGFVNGERESNGYDLVNFQTNSGENLKAPSNYQGMSGGALWRVYITPDDNGHASICDKRIVGVAFHQTENIEGARTITCHGPNSVYEVLAQQIRQRWPSEFH